jgi:hypothetical protein
MRITSEFSKETKKTWNDIFKSLKENNFQSRILYPAKISFKIGG